MANDVATLQSIEDKLDKLVSAHIFDPDEILVLQRLIQMVRNTEGFVHVTKNLGIILTFIVVIWTQWDRLVELVQSLRGKP